MVDGVIDLLNYVPQPTVLTLEPDKINALLGTGIPEDEMVRILQRPAHDARQTYRPPLVGNDQMVGVQRVLPAVQGGELFALSGTADDDLPAPGRPRGGVRDHPQPPGLPVRHRPGPGGGGYL